MQARMVIALSGSKSMMMMKYEYYVTSFFDPDNLTFERNLSSLGEQGWMLISVIPAPNSTHRYIFSRPVKEKSNDV